MKSKEEEYKEIFLAEALENFEEINRQLISLEKNKSDNTIHALFRITHTLKGNAAGMGFTGIDDIAHVLEDIFGEVRAGKINLDDNIFASLYKGVDTLGALINAINTGAEVKYRGIKTKLEVIIRRAGEQVIKEEESNPIESSQQELTPAVLNENLNEESESLPEADTKISFSDLVQVPVRKLDNLLTLVGELMIEKDRILATQGHGLRGSNEYA